MPMIASMTGYGVATGKTPVGVATVECRSVNSRFLDLNLRVCEELRFVEPLLREALFLTLLPCHIATKRIFLLQ